MHIVKATRLFEGWLGAQTTRRNFAVIKGLLIAMQAADGRGIATPAGLAAG